MAPKGWTFVTIMALGMNILAFVIPCIWKGKVVKA